MQTAWSREGVRKNGGREVTVTGQEYPLKDMPGEIQFRLLLYNSTLAHGQVRSGGLWNNRPRQQRDVWSNNQRKSVKWSALANCVGVLRNGGRKNSLKENALIENCKITKKTPKCVNNQKMHSNIYDVFYSRCSHQHYLGGTPTIFRVMFLLQEYSGG